MMCTALMMMIKQLAKILLALVRGSTLIGQEIINLKKHIVYLQVGRFLKSGGVCLLISYYLVRGAAISFTY